MTTSRNARPPPRSAHSNFRRAAEPEEPRLEYDRGVIGAVDLNICEPPLGWEETGGALLEERDDESEDEDFGPDGLENRLEEFVDHAQAEAGPDRAGELADAAGDDN